MSVALTCSLFFEFLLLPISPEKKYIYIVPNSVLHLEAVFCPSLWKTQITMTFLLQWNIFLIISPKGGVVNYRALFLSCFYSTIFYNVHSFELNSGVRQQVLNVSSVWRGERGNIYCWLNIMCQTPCDVLLPSSFHSFFHGKIFLKVLFMHWERKEVVSCSEWKGSL